MRTVITILCLGVLAADMGFCGGSRNRSPAPQQQTKFNADAKAADDSLSAVEVTLKRFEETPARVTFPDLAALDEKFAEAEESVGAAFTDSERDPTARQGADDLKVKMRKLDERLAAVYRKRLNTEELARLDAALHVAGELTVCDNNLRRVEQTPPGQERVARFCLPDGHYVTMDVRAALRDMGEQTTRAEKALAAAREFIDGPSREHIRARQRSKLEAALTTYADCAKRLDAARKARGVE